VPRTQTELPSFDEEVRSGLSADSRALPCRFFYDEPGSKIFEEICQLDEYYLTRAERSILAERASEIVDQVAADVALVELGSGNAEKSRLLIEVLLERQKSLRFLPIDISRSVLEAGSQALLVDHPGLEIHAICGEYEAGLHELKRQPGGAQLILWLGSSIGNLHKPQAAKFLARVREEMAPGDGLLVGIDLRKEREVLESAYDDIHGVTARFNKNLLGRINRELGGHFDVRQFGFHARYDQASGAVASSLVSLCDQEVPIDALGVAYVFKENEEIHTENSYKYSFEEIDQLASDSGMECRKRWLDADGHYSLNLLSPA